jgi:hypothetical protein
MDHHDFFNIPGYKIYYNNSKINQNDGVVMYIHNNIIETTEVTEIQKLKVINSTITLDNDKQLLITALYRCHSLKKTEFTLYFKDLLRMNRKLKNHLIIGDFNIDINSNETMDQEFLQILLENGYYPGFNKTTRPANSDINKGTCIDNIYIKLQQMEHKNFTLAIPFNDHYPILMSLKKTKKINKPNTYKYIDYNKLAEIGKNTNWTDIQYNDPNTAIDQLIIKIKQCISKSEILNKSNKTIPRKSWITKAIIKSCLTKERLYKQWKKDPNNTLKKDAYKNYAKILHKTINIARNSHEKKLIEKNQNNQKNLWNIINTKLGKNIKNDNHINYLKHDNIKITNPDNIAENMNKYFCSIGKKMRNKIQKPQNENIQMPPMNDSSLYLFPTNSNEIREIIRCLKNKKGGIDGIDAQVLKTLQEYTSQPLANIFNKCIENGIWPDALKAAEVIPIHKGKEKHLPSNYRPISLISNIAKIFEKLLHKRLLNFLEKNNIISVKQFGFRKNKSTKDALNYVTNLIYNQLDKSKPIAATFLDLAKAFDTVDHTILLNKLYNYGIRGNANKLFESYLSNRKQRVKVNNTYSNFDKIETGVPQGTVLGPLLFIIYINDLFSILPEETIISFADDTAVIVKGNNWKEVESKMNIYLYKISIWLALNKLSLNIDKTVYMEFGCTQNSTPKNLNIKIQDKDLTRVDNTKYLGIIIDSNLRWENHITHIYNKTKYLIFVFYKLAKILTQDILKMLYFALFHSIMSYGIISWGGAYTSTTRIFQMLQNRLLKIINKNNFPKEQQPLNIDQQFSFDSLLYHYEDLKDSYLTSNSNTRNKSIIIPKLLKKISNKMSYIRAITCFNNLPNSLKTLNSKRSRKTKLKEWIKSY